MRKILGLSCLVLSFFYTTSISPMGPTATCNPSSLNTPQGKNVNMNSTWTYQAGDVLYFTPNLQGNFSDVLVVFSNSSSQPTGSTPLLMLAIGRNDLVYGQYTSLCCNINYGSISGCNNTNIKSSSGITYWVQLSANGSTLSYGTGNNAPNGQITQWVIPTANQITPQYFGLGGYSTAINFTNIGIAAPTSPTTAASSFTYQVPSSVTGATTVTFKPNWTYSAGNVLCFTPNLTNGLGDVVVVLSATQDQTSPILKLAMGRHGGQYTSLGIDANYDTAPNSNWSNVNVNFQNNTTYWVQLSADLTTLSCGTGNTVNEDLIGSWTIPPANRFTPKYFGLGGWDHPIIFSKIGTAIAQSTAATAGATAFTFDPTNLGQETNGVYYNQTNWLFPTPDKGTLKFNANPSGNDGFLVQFRAAADMPFVAATNGGWYYNLMINTSGATLQSYSAIETPVGSGTYDWSRMTTVGSTNTLHTTTGTAEEWWVTVNGDKITVDMVGSATTAEKTADSAIAKAEKAEKAAKTMAEKAAAAKALKKAKAELAKAEKAAKSKSSTAAAASKQFTFTIPTDYVIPKIQYFALGGATSKVVYTKIDSGLTAADKAAALKAAKATKKAAKVKKAAPKSPTGGPH